MSESIVQHQYKDSVIPQRDSDGYVDATKMVAGFPGKKISHFRANKQTEAYLEALSANAGIPALELIQSEVGGDHSGTWVHPEVAVKLAAWLSPEFEVWVFRTIVGITAKSAKKESQSNDDDYLLKLKRSETIAQLITNCLGGADLGVTQKDKETLVAKTQLSLLDIRHPELKEEIGLAHKLLDKPKPKSDSLFAPVSKENRMTAADIAKRFKDRPPIETAGTLYMALANSIALSKSLRWVTPQAIASRLCVKDAQVEKILCDLGLQKETPNQDWRFEVTEKGKKHSIISSKHLDESPILWAVKMIDVVATIL